MNVWPKNDVLRRILKHPIAGGFIPPDGPGDWPDDSFTHRLVRDGDLLTKEPAAPHPVKASKEK
jgi:hypothetical protein